MSIDILAFGAHPDDVECAAAGVILKTISKAGKVVIADLTRGELGSFGDEHSRNREAAAASKKLGLFAREQLNLMDGNIENTHENRLKVIQLIRKYQPKIILANAIFDRHSDHKKAADLISEASFLSGLRKIETYNDGQLQHKWRPGAVYHYIQDYFIKPDVVVDISDFFNQKTEVIRAYDTQFVSAADASAAGILNLLKQIESTNQIFGRAIGVKYAEGFTCERYIGTKDLMDLI
ncbi:bacillithiol biosynthesis deacetylase BshB1 [Flavobacterium circumlabens]|uniref:Bacillithiol biosynthesis deacetylase BshB1 n=1 Tax=Flavobacterium circumlabens TaxID=2133765 RepID=A0A4Y7U950_9FLAO|nr:bacillithiol biosynthesis deacetylase BshB1 [Flavobacterium circumlabens]TCN55633.1 bacillithiol biosynthesis deacetylase BshB1 [Flavobacterium circumlabens]TEB42967.1 bacillithiol biosynthesis deacetylase BshB1 [Flavobacterium circumlabens]